MEDLTYVKSSVRIGEINQPDRTYSQYTGGGRVFATLAYVAVLGSMYG